MKIPDCCLNHDKLDSLRARIQEAGVLKASSYHSGGINALLMDGSVRFVANSVDMRVWRAVSTRSGGEVDQF
jgi:prepilin-type processing-associated H-X9-DG protein